MEVNLYHAYSEATRDHFYTIDTKEYHNSILNLGYTAKGVSCKVFNGTREGLVPLYTMSFKEVTAGIATYHCTYLPDRNKWSSSTL